MVFGESLKTLGDAEVCFVLLGASLCWYCWCWWWL